MHKNFMAKVLEDTNQGTPFDKGSCAFLFFGNIGAPLMATLNILGFNVRLVPVWLWTTRNIQNSLDAPLIRTLFHGHRMDVNPLTFASMKSTTSPSPSSGESLPTSKKKKSPTSVSHVGDLHLTSVSHAGGKQPVVASHARSESPITASHTSIKSPTSTSHVGYLGLAFASHPGGKKLAVGSHVGRESQDIANHTDISLPTSASHVGVMPTTSC
jgi:hypothetical protein